MGLSRQKGFGGSQAVAACTTALSLVALLVPATSGAANPVSFLSASGTCSPPDNGTDWSTAGAGSAHPDTIATYAAEGPVSWSPGPETVGPDLVWSHGPSFDAGDSAQGLVICGSPTPFSVHFYDLPTTPTSFSGATTPGSFDSQLYFDAPGKAQYVADLSLSGGAVTLSADNGRSHTFASSGRFQLATLPRGGHAVMLAADNGPQAQWTVSFRALPVSLSAVGFSPAIIAPGEIADLLYTTSGATRVSVTIDKSNGQPVRILATDHRVGLGDHMLTWDGRTQEGTALPDGLYTAHVVTQDPGGASEAQHAHVRIDRPPDTFWTEHPPRSSRHTMVRFRFRSHGSRSSFECQRSRGWGKCSSPQVFRLMPGRHHFAVRARDAYGVVDPTPARWHFRIR